LRLKKAPAIALPAVQQNCVAMMLTLAMMALTNFTLSLASSQMAGPTNGKPAPFLALKTLPTKYHWPAVAGKLCLHRVIPN
jgi:hypothetical protein